MKRFFIAYLFFLLPILTFPQGKPEPVGVVKLSKESAERLKRKIQQVYVEDLSVSIDNFLSTVASASNGRMAGSMSIPLTCVPKNQNPAPPAPPLLQYQALLNLYANNGGASWARKSGWQNAPTTPIPVHNWDGVCVNSAGQVIGLDLSNNGLVGNLPATFWNLTSLRYLNLSGNSLAGPLSSSISNFSQLQYLDLHSNSFTGPIPPTIGNIGSLVSINLDGNGFNGNIPTQLGSLANLSELILSNNAFSGQIPSQLGSANNLVILNLSYNAGLTGNIPTTLGGLNKLVALLLIDCNFTGSIPTTFSNLTALQELYLTANALVSVVPSNLGLLQNLRVLELGQNQLVSPIPPSIFSSNSIESLSLYENNFTGTLEGISGMGNLKDLVVYANQFSGQIPAAFNSLSNLRIVNLAFNNFQGPLQPEFLTATSNLIEVNLRNNPNLGGKLNEGIRLASGTVDISYSGFTFSDFLHLVGPLPESRFSYSPQGLLGVQVDTTERIGFPHVFIATVDRFTTPNSKFRWYKMVNGVETPLQPDFSELNYRYKIQHLVAADFGTYFYRIVNDNAGALTLQSKNYTLSQNTASLGTLGINAYNLYCAVAFEMAPQLIPGCSPISASWNFGDGRTSNKENPLHAYGSGGTYQVTLSMNFVCGESIVFTFIANKSLPFSPSTILPVKMVDRTLTSVTRGTNSTLDASFQTFSDAWNRTLDLEVDTLNGYVNGKLGFWGPSTSYFFDKDRSYSGALDIEKDGTFQLGGFASQLAQYNVVPGFVKASEITGLSGEGFFDESMDALGIFSTQLYGYESGSVIASAANARKNEVLTVDFENLNSPSSGNWILGEPGRSSPGRTTPVTIVASGPYTLTLDKTMSSISHFDKISLILSYPAWRPYLTDVPILCMQVNPLNNAQTILILDVEKSILDLAASAFFVSNLATPRFLIYDDQFAHSGKRSLRFVNANESVTQDLFQLVSGKEYTFSAWISDKQATSSAVSDPNQGIQLKFETRGGTLISSVKFSPSVHSIETWKKVSGNFIPPAGTERITFTFTRGGSPQIWIDDIRIHPAEAQMKSYVYELSSLRLSAVLDEENYATYYIYDEEGKLRLLKKETQSGIMTITEVQDYLVPNTTGIVSY